MNSCKKFDPETMRQFLYEIHLVQKGETYSKTLEGKSEKKKSPIITEKILNDLFLVRVDRDPGFYSYILQEITGNKEIKYTVLQYITKLIDDYSVSFESFLIRNKSASDIETLHYEIASPESFLHRKANEKGDQPCSSPLSGRDLKQIRRFYEFWSAEDLVNSNEMKNSVVRNILSRQYLHLNGADRVYHHAGAFKTPLIDNVTTDTFSEEKKWDTQSEIFIRQRIRNPREYIDEVIYTQGPKYHPIYSNYLPECDKLKMTIADYFSSYLWLPHNILAEPKIENSRSTSEEISSEIFLSDALLIAAEIWFSGMSMGDKVKFLNDDYSTYSPELKALTQNGMSVDDFWAHLDTLEFFQYESVKKALDLAPTAFTEESKWTELSDHWFELMEFQEIIDNLETGFFNQGNSCWNKHYNIPGNIIGSYLKLGEHEKASKAIHLVIASEFEDSQGSYPPHLDIIVSHIISRAQFAGNGIAHEILDELTAEIGIFWDQCEVMQFMMRILQDIKWYKKGIQYVNTLIKEYPDVSWIWQMYYEKGLMLLESGKPKNALSYFEKALEHYCSYENQKSFVYYNQALAQFHLGHWSDAYASALNSHYLLSPGNKDCRNLIEQLKSCLDNHVDIESVRSSDAKCEFLTAEQLALDYLVKSPDNVQLDFYSPVMSIAKGLEILLDREITATVREEIKKSPYWNDRTGIEYRLFSTTPDCYKWALGNSDQNRQSISLGTWSRFEKHDTQNHEIMDIFEQYIKDRFGNSFEQIKRACKDLEKHRNGVAHSKLMDKNKAKEIFYDSIEKINTVIRILYGENQGSSSKVVVTEMENEPIDTLISKGKCFLQCRDYEFADYIFVKALENIKETRDVKDVSTSEDQVQLQKTEKIPSDPSNYRAVEIYTLKAVAQSFLNNNDGVQNCIREAKKIDSSITKETIRQNVEFYKNISYSL